MKIDNGARMNGTAYSAESAVRADFKAKPAEMQNGAEPNVLQKPKTSPQQLSGQMGGQQEGKSTEDADSRKLKNAVDHANQTMRHAKTKCEFSYHEETKRVSIKVIDEETDEVIREIPPEETLEMLSKMWELAGLMVDEKR